MEKEQILLKYIKFVIILFLVVSMSIAVRIPAYASENEEIGQLEMERQQALEMIEGLKTSISSVQENIDDLTIEKNDIQSYIKSLDGQINVLTNELADFEIKIEDKIVSIEETKISLEQAKKNCEQQYKAMKIRIRYMYENGKSNILEMFIGANSMSDMLKQATFMEAVYTYDRNMLEEYTAIKDEIEEEIAKAANPDKYTGTVTGFIWPCPDYKRISSYFGPRPQPVPGASTNHKGIDLTASYGAAILASASGMVTTATHSNSAGNYIVIAHGNGMSTVYMHCSSLLVSAGDNVEQGEVIAKVGSTGYSSGNHLHFGVIKNGIYVDPLGYVSN